MLDIKFVRENPDAVKENIRKKFQDAKLPLVDEVIGLDAKYRKCLQEAENLKAQRNKLSKANGPLFGQLKKCTDEAKKAELQAQIDANNAAVKADADQLAALDAEKDKMAARIQEIMYTIPQMIDPSVPIGPDDTHNVEAQRFGEPVVPDFPIPYHTEIMESFDGIDMDAAGRVAGNGFYYLLGNIARLHEAVLAYARDFMIGKGFTYVIPPFMMHGNVVQGVMSFPEMDAMMYKIEGEDLYLIGTSEHSMIGKFIDQISEAVETIRKNPDSRRIIVNAWNVADLKNMNLPPCHMFFQFYVANGRLSLQMYQRSADTFLGVPFNIASYALLLQMMAQVTGLKAGDFIHTLGDAHIYLNHLEQVDLQLTRTPRPLPVMKLNPDVKDIFGFRYEDFQLEGYDPWPHIAGKVSV